MEAQDLDRLSPEELCRLAQRLEDEIHVLEVQRCQLSTLKRHVLSRIYRGDPAHAPRFRDYPPPVYDAAADVA